MSAEHGSKMCLADSRYFSFLVYDNIPFCTSESPYFKEWVGSIRQTYEAPSRYVLMKTILPAEAARVQLVEQERLKGRNMLTLMTDGRDDQKHHSLYGTMVAERTKYPIISSLDDITGQRGSAETIERVLDASLEKMLVKPEQIAALVTDNPSVMQAVRSRFEQKHLWVLVSTLGG